MNPIFVDLVLLATGFAFGVAFAAFLTLYKHPYFDEPRDDHNDDYSWLK